MIFELTLQHVTPALPAGAELLTLPLPLLVPLFFLFSVSDGHFFPPGPKNSDGSFLLYFCGGGDFQATL